MHLDYFVEIHLAQFSCRRHPVGELSAYLMSCFVTSIFYFWNKLWFSKEHSID